MNTDDQPPIGLDAAVADVKASIVFLTRIPAGWIGGVAERPDFSRGARMFPAVGALIGAIGGLTILVSDWLAVPTLIGATLAVLATFLVTGGLHEDGLADTLDGFGGGATRERKLEIMDDSRVGTYGAAGLIFSIVLRIAALSSLMAGHPFRGAFALVAAEAVSRAALVRLWHALPAARPGGLAHDTGPPDQGAMVVALGLALAIVLALVWPSAGFLAAVIGILLSIAATYIFTRIAAREIGGRTGDTLGACQQIAAIAFLIGVAVAA